MLALSCSRKRKKRFGIRCFSDDGYGARPQHHLGLPVLRESAASHDDEVATTDPFVLWPPPAHLKGYAEERASYFSELNKPPRQPPPLRRASSLLDLINIRAMHSKSLHRRCLGTALGFRSRNSQTTDIPAIIVFVSRKLHRKWVTEEQLLPQQLQGADGVWCDVDVVEFSYYGVTTTAPREQIYSSIVEGVRGNKTQIGAGSQVASVEAYGSLGVIVRSLRDTKRVGFVTNRHLAVDLDIPNQKIYHPLPPGMGPGIYLGSVERAASFVSDKVWYGVFASTNTESYVRADVAFVAFTEDVERSKLTTRVEGIEPKEEAGEVLNVRLEDDVGSIVGRRVVKLGRSSGLTEGIIVAYGVEYNDDKGNTFFTDFLIVGDNKDVALPFDLEGDSGSMVLMVSEVDGAAHRPLGMIWGGTSNRGRLKLKHGGRPDNWTSAVDLGRLLRVLNLEVVSTESALDDAFKEQKEMMRNQGDDAPSPMHED